MELLTDSESRDFTRFLDSFASSSAGPPSSSVAASSVPPPTHAFTAPQPPAPPQAVGSSSRRTLAHGGAATWDLGGWAEPSQQNSHSHLQPRPAPLEFPHRSSGSHGVVPLAQRRHNYATVAHPAHLSLPRPPHLSHAAPPPPHHSAQQPPYYEYSHHHSARGTSAARTGSGTAPRVAAGSEADRRARMAQHARDLEAWMAQGERTLSRPGPSATVGGQSHGFEDEDDEDDGREERGLPPRKRERERGRPPNPNGASSSQPGARAERAYYGAEDPLVLMLEEAERRAGWPGVARTQGSGNGTTFAPPAPASAPEHALFQAAQVAAAAEQHDEQQRAPHSGSLAPALSAGAAPAKRKPGPATAPTRKRRAAQDHALGIGAGSASSSSASASATLQVGTAPGPRSKTTNGSRKKAAGSNVEMQEDTLMTDPMMSAPNNDDPDAHHDNPGPCPTPSNIPRAPFRPRRLLGPVRAMSTPSESTPAPPAAGGSSAGPSKGALLTAEQKKANHIASEQKRRAAIRQGYDGLCEVVPALRAAVQEFEERVRRVTNGGGAGAALDGEDSAKGARKRAGRGTDGQSTTGALMGGIQVGGEKIDGRAGPKSEAVVLGKTVEYVRHLLDERSSLLARLSNAYAIGTQSGIALAPAPGVYGSEWDERWDESMRAEVLATTSEREARRGIKEEDANELDAEWEDEETA